MRKMNRKKTLTAALVLICGLSLTFGLMVSALDPASEIAKELICTCGCGKVVYDCYCDLAKEFKSEIAEALDAGKTKRQIINGFVERYGDQVLATPKKTGLELTIWTLPIFASILGTVVIYRYARKKAPIPDSEIGAAILDEWKESSEADELESASQRYYELYYEEYAKARREEEQASHG